MAKLRTDGLNSLVPLAALSQASIAVGHKLLGIQTVVPCAATSATWSTFFSKQRPFDGLQTKSRIDRSSDRFSLLCWILSFTSPSKPFLSCSTFKVAPPKSKPLPAFLHCSAQQTQPTNRP